jgi:hypothetical protein
MTRYLVTSWTAGGWSGNIGSLDDSVQKIAERYQIRYGNYNACAYYGLGVNATLPENRDRVWPDMCKSQRCKSSCDRDVKGTIAESLRNVIRIFRVWILKLVSHD